MIDAPPRAAVPTSRPRSLSFDRLGTALLFLTIACSACLMPAQSDTWWHLRTGEEIWRHGRVLLRDTYSYTVGGAYWPNHEWLSQLLFYGTFRLGGMPLLTALAALLVTTAWWIVWRHSSGGGATRLIVFALAVLPSAMSWSLRPQLATYLFVAITSWLLVKRRYLYLPACFILWANLHGGVVLGFVLIAAAGISSALDKRRVSGALVATFFACAAGTALTPLGLRLWTEIPASLERLRHYQVLEWRPPSFTDVHLLPFWLTAGALTVLVARRARGLLRGQTPLIIIEALCLLPFALRSARQVPPFLLLATPALAGLLAGIRPAASRRDASRERPAFNWALLLMTLTVEIAAVAYAWQGGIERLRWHPIPDLAVTAIRSCPERLYNSYDDGGYLIWFVPERKVFMDSRQDPYPVALVDAHIKLEETGDYRRLFDRYQIRCALTHEPSVLAARLRSEGWNSLYDDDRWQVLAR